MTKSTTIKKKKKTESKKKKKKTGKLFAFLPAMSRVRVALHPCQHVTLSGFFAFSHYNQW